MPNYDFKTDFPIARKTESDIASALVELYDATILEVGKDNRFDLRVLIKGIEITIEIKEDFLCEKTGNVGMEYSCRGKDSGIRVSKADYYLYKLHTAKGIVYVIHHTNTLKKKIRNREYFRVVNGGDKGSNSMNYLFKYEEFIKSGKFLPLDRIKEVC